MANPEGTSNDTVPSETPKAVVPMLPLVASMVIAVLLACGVLGGAGWWLVRSGKIALGSSTAKPAAIPAASTTVHEVALDPLLVNLSDPGGHAYLRVTMTLSVEDPSATGTAKPKEEKAEKGKVAAPEHNAEIRDAALNVIGQQSSDTLLAENGKEHLKTQLRNAIQHEVPSMKVADLYFTEFLVQR